MSTFIPIFIKSPLHSTTYHPFFANKEPHANGEPRYAYLKGESWVKVKGSEARPNLI